MNGGIAFPIVAMLASILIPPALGLLFRWLHARRGFDTGAGSGLTLKQLWLELLQQGKAGERETWTEQVCAATSLVFSLLAVAMLAMQMHLLPAVFLYSFASLAAIAALMAKEDRAQGKLLHGLAREYVLFQSLLLAAAAGYYALNGTFVIVDSLRQPGTLFWEAPFLLAALLCMAFVCLNGKFAGLPGAVFSVELFGGAAGLANKLAEVYRIGFLLLLAGVLIGGKAGPGALAAIGFYVVMSWPGPVLTRLLRRNRVELRWGYVLGAAAINLIWLYIKYV